MLKLYGSTTSPYVRRIRILLGSTEHEFINMQIFEGTDRKTLIANNPTLKIPMLDDDGTVIYDSRVIYRYLSEKDQDPALTWKQENLLTVIDSVNDSLVQILLLDRSGYDVKEDRLYFKLQRERAAHALQHLSEQVSDGTFAEWDYPSVCLYCLLDWVAFRELHDLSAFPILLQFMTEHQDRIEVSATNPRQ